MNRPTRRFVAGLAAILTASTALAGGQLSTVQPAAAQSSDPWEDCRLPAPPGLLVENEGWETHERFLDPTEAPNGVLRGIFLFVDFDGAPGTATERDDVENMFDPALPDWFDAVSYGQLTLELDFTTTWARMPHDHDDETEYPWPPNSPQFQNYIQDAVNVWDATVDFEPYDLVYVASPVDATGIFSSPAFILGETNAVVANNGEVLIRYGSNAARDRMNFGYQMLAHETGHVFGLPDLYKLGEPDPIERARHIGGWDTMGRVDGPAPEYLAYHKWKIGWLEDDQIVCMDEPGSLEQILTPLHAPPDGESDKKAVMIPIDTNRLVVVENRDGGSLIDGTPPECYQEGLLTYVVDSRVRTGGEVLPGETETTMPVEVIDANPGPMTECDDEAQVRAYEQVRVKANATLANVTDSVQAEGISVQLIDIDGADREVQVSWTGAAAPCEVDYTITDSWPGNVQVELVVENTTTETINGWTAEWAFTGDESVYNSWGVSVSQVGAQATATGDGWGVTIPAEGTVAVGFQATVTGTPTVPSPISCTA